LERTPTAEGFGTAPKDFSPGVISSTIRMTVLPSAVDVRMAEVTGIHAGGFRQMSISHQGASLDIL
jgi:hypothetical protein